MGMDFSADHVIYRLAMKEDAPEIMNLRNAVSLDLTNQFGKGHWSLLSSETFIHHTIHLVLIFLDEQLAGMFRLAQKKPWAIDASCFTPVAKPLYLLDMVVRPDLQHRGVGTLMLQEARRRALLWPAHAIRLDAYDAEAGAGNFYAKCGFKKVGRPCSATYPCCTLNFFCNDL